MSGITKKAVKMIDNVNPYLLLFAEISYKLSR